MNEERLRQILKGMHVPEPTEGAFEKAEYHSRIAFQNRRDEATIRTKSWTFLLLTGSALSMIVIGFVAGFGVGKKDAVSNGHLAMLVQMEALFEGRLDAVISGNGKVEVVLGTEDQMANDQRVWARLRNGSASVDLLTYSGKSVCLEFDGRKFCFEVLMRENGAILLVGDQFVWDSAQADSTGSLQISAGSLAPERKKT